MTVSNAYLEWLTDVLTPVGPVASRRMFGGAGLYLREIFFAVVIDDVLHLKADEQNRVTFEAAGAAQLSYRRGRKDVLLPFWEVPEEIAADEDALRAWAEMAVEAGRRTRKPPARRANPKK
jgi:DNA transformation protein and related proteins